MSAQERPILEHIEEHKKTWQQLWLTMAEGDVSRYNDIKKMDVLTEFWVYFDLWRAKQKQAIEDHKRHNNKLRNNG